MELPKVGIIIINWNSFDLTHLCLKSIESINYSNYKVFLVDNDSSDDSLQKLVSEHPWIIPVVNNENLGFTGGNNSGIDIALKNGCEYILLLNNDTQVEEDFLSILVDKITSDNSIGAVQPKIYYEFDRSIIWNAGGRYNPVITKPSTIGENQIDNGAYESSFESDWITGCAFMFRSSLIREIGYTCELYFYGCFDDVDYSLKIRGKGYRLFFCADAKIYHAVGMASKSKTQSKEGVLKPFFHYLVTRNNWFLIRRHTRVVNIFPTIIYQTYNFIGHTIYFIYKRRFKKLKAYVHGYYHGIVKPLNPKKLNHTHYIQLYK